MSEKITAADAIRLLDAHEAAAVDRPGAGRCFAGRATSPAQSCCRWVRC